MIRRGSVVLMLCCGVAHAQTQPSSQAPATQPLSAIGEPTRVTLHFQKLPPKEAFDRLEQASKLHVSTLQPDQMAHADGSISVDFDNTTYLTALLEMCRQSNLQISTIGARLMVLPSSGKRTIPPYVGAGPLAIFCNAVTIVHEVRYGEHDRASASAVLNFSLVGEARVPVIGIDGPAFNIHAIDQNGHSLSLLDMPRSLVSIPAADAMSENRFFAVQLAIDPAASNSLAVLGGTVIAKVISKTDVLTIKDLMAAEGTSARLGDSIFSVTKLEPAGPPGQYQVDIDVKSSTLSPTFFARIRFSDSQFLPRMEPAVNIVRVNNIQSNGDRLTVSLLLAIPPQGGAEKRPLNLVWPLPSELRRVEVPFEFHDLKLR